MGSHQATLDAYDGVQITLPNGREVSFTCLTVAEGARFWRLLMQAEGGEPAAQIEILESFPAAIGMDAEAERLTPAEVYEVLRRFLSLRRGPVKKTTPGTEREAGAALSSIGGSTT